MSVLANVADNVRISSAAESILNRDGVSLPNNFYATCINECSVVDIGISIYFLSSIHTGLYFM